MTLPNISELCDELEELVNNYGDTELRLSETFKNEYEKTLKDDEEITFFDRTAIQTNAEGLTTYIPYQWFLVSLILSKIIGPIELHKEMSQNIIKESGDEPETGKSEWYQKLYTDAKTTENSTLEQYINSADNISESDREKLIEFVTNYDSWRGGKTINRGDYIHSAVLTIANLVHANASMVYNIAKALQNNETLADYIDAPMELFEIVNKEDSEENLIKEDSGNIKRIDKNVIYYGAPGTGKSYDVDQMIREEYSQYDVIDNPDSKYVYRTTIYSDYSYHDFIGHIMPMTNQGDVTYSFAPGVFTRALSAALNSDKNVYLIIEEMSRGNIASIFGDIFQLLDRDENGQSTFPITNENIAREIRHYSLSENEKRINEQGIEQELLEENYSDYQIKIPSNLLIYGTLNASDQNVFVLDTAFKRRFNFKYLSVDPIKDNNIYINDFDFSLDNSNKKISWISFYQAINKFIQLELSLPEDKLIGQFFIQGKITEKKGNIDEINIYNTNQIADKLLHYLWDDIEKIATVSSPKSTLFEIKETDRQFSRVHEKFINGEKIFDEKVYSFIEEFEVLGKTEDIDAIENEIEESQSESVINEQEETE